MEIKIKDKKVANFVGNILRNQKNEIVELLIFSLMDEHRLKSRQVYDLREHFNGMDIYTILNTDVNDVFYDIKDKYLRKVDELSNSVFFTKEMLDRLTLMTLVELGDFIDNIQNTSLKERDEFIKNTLS